jgi:hypothetical protein
MPYHVYADYCGATTFPRVASGDAVRVRGAGQVIAGLPRDFFREGSGEMKTSKIGAMPIAMVMAAALLGISAPAFAQVNGAIFTTPSCRRQFDESMHNA